MNRLESINKTQILDIFGDILKTAETGELNDNIKNKGANIINKLLEGQIKMDKIFNLLGSDEFQLV